ncbi:MAG: YihY/virulence factor BrkB family protein [Woeseiaceae bacterium]|nr:YihY/virulence factor BrkB family protein [Woeseiaceae bacterium]
MVQATAARTRLRALWERARHVAVLGVLIRAAEQSQKNQGKDIAAGIAYYTFLSIFPLLLGLVSLGGFFLRSEELQRRLNTLVVETLPASAEFVARNIESVVKIRGAAGITSVLVLLWSASKLVGVLSRSVNRTLGLRRDYAAYLSPLRYFLITVLVAVLVIVAITVAPIVDVLAELQLTFVGPRLNAIMKVIAGNTVGAAITVCLMTVVYMLIPYRRPSFREILPGLVAATVALEVGKRAFAWYVEQSADYSAVYGSLSSIIVMLLWLYFAARIVLYGAEVISVTWNDRRSAGDQDRP